MVNASSTLLPSLHFSPWLVTRKHPLRKRRLAFPPLSGWSPCGPGRPEANCGTRAGEHASLEALLQRSCPYVTSIQGIVYGSAGRCTCRSDVVRLTGPTVCRPHYRTGIAVVRYGRRSVHCSVLRMISSTAGSGFLIVPFFKEVTLYRLSLSANVFRSRLLGT